MDGQYRRSRYIFSRVQGARTMVHLVTVELVGPRLPTDRGLIETAIRGLGPCYAFHPAGWIVESELSNRAICERLAPLLKPQDRLMATRIHRDWVTANVPQKEVDWLAGCNFTAAHDRDPAVPRVPTVRG
jgi:hypothetical protein